MKFLTDLKQKLSTPEVKAQIQTVAQSVVVVLAVLAVSVAITTASGMIADNYFPVDAELLTDDPFVNPDLNV